jgi:hypothetical protein
MVPFYGMLCKLCICTIFVLTLYGGEESSVCPKDSVQYCVCYTVPETSYGYSVNIPEQNVWTNTILIKVILVIVRSNNTSVHIYLVQHMLGGFHLLMLAAGSVFSEVFHM